MKAGFHWIVEVARCCGRKYKRERLTDRPWPGTHHDVCCHCRKPLGYAKASHKLARNLRQRRQRAARVAAGLTTRGGQRQSQYRTDIRHLHGKERRNARMRAVTRERSAQGLTARGTPRKLKHPAPTPQAIAYAALRAEMDQQSADGIRPLPIATGFRDEANIARGGATANGRAFMSNLITRGTNKEAA